MRVRLIASVAVLLFTAATAFARTTAVIVSFPNWSSRAAAGSVPAIVCNSPATASTSSLSATIKWVRQDWPYRNGQLQTAGMEVLRSRPAGTNSGRHLGLALSPDKENQHVAIGGIGQPSTSTVVVLDRATKKVLHQTVAVPPRGENSNAIWSIAYAPDGKHIAFGDSYGGVWLWNLTAPRSACPAAAQKRGEGERRSLCAFLRRKHAGFRHGKRQGEPVGSVQNAGGARRA